MNGLETAPSKEVSYRLVCLGGLLQLSKARALLGEEEIGRITQLFYGIVVHEESYGTDEVKEAAINALVEIAHQKPQVVVEKTFPAFMAQLPDTDPDGSTAYVSVLEAFSKLACEEKVFDTVILRLKNKFASAANQHVSSAYIVALLSAMLYALTVGATRLEQNPDFSTYYQDIAMPLLKRTSHADGSHTKAFDDETTLDIVGRICSIIVRSQSTEQQQAVAAELHTLFTGIQQDELPPFNFSAAEGTSKTMIVSTHLLASFRREIRLPCEMELLVSSLAEYTQQACLSAPVRSASLRQLSLVINKFHSTSALKSCLDPLINAPFELFNPQKLDLPRIRIAFACLKGIAIQSSPALSTLYPHLLSFLCHEQYGTAVAHGFSTLLQPDDLLTKQNHCRISSLHKQKSFALLVPSMTQAFRGAAPAVKPNYLIALSGVLRWMPFSIVVSEIAQLVPLLLQCLDLTHEGVGVADASSLRLRGDEEGKLVHASR